MNPFKQLLASLLIGLSLLLVTSSASANVLCSPTAVNSDSAGHITVQCDGTWYFGQANVCGANIDAVKMWLSLIQAAILSGRVLRIATSQSSGCENYLIWLQMDK